jgi:hypothetical protein
MPSAWSEPWAFTRCPGARFVEMWLAHILRASLPHKSLAGDLNRIASFSDASLFTLTVFECIHNFGQTCTSSRASAIEPYAVCILPMGTADQPSRPCTELRGASWHDSDRRRVLQQLNNMSPAFLFRATGFHWLPTHPSLLGVRAVRTSMFSRRSVLLSIPRKRLPLQSLQLRNIFQGKIGVCAYFSLAFSVGCCESYRKTRLARFVWLRLQNCLHHGQQ